jgi:hypothetical protein
MQMTNSRVERILRNSVSRGVDSSSFNLCVKELALRLLLHVDPAASVLLSTECSVAPGYSDIDQPCIHQDGTLGCAQRIPRRPRPLRLNQPTSYRSPPKPFRACVVDSRLFCSCNPSCSAPPHAPHRQNHTEHKLRASRPVCVPSCCGRPLAFSVADWI